MMNVMVIKPFFAVIVVGRWFCENINTFSNFPWLKYLFCKIAAEKMLVLSFTIFSLKFSVVW